MANQKTVKAKTGVKIRKRSQLFCWTKGGVIFVLVVLLFQFVYYVYVIEGSSTIPKKPDMILVYGGETFKRIAAGLDIARKRRVPYFLVSNDSNREVTNALKILGKPGSAELIIDGTAKTTDQNARFSSHLIRRLPVKTVVLVTARYHMPRALFLTRLYLLGTHVKVYPFPLNLPNPQTWKSRKLWLDCFKFWGSIYRIVSAKD